MFTEGALRIEVQRGGKVSVLDVQSDRALIGSGAHCDVRLAPDEAAIEQLAVETMDEGVHARALALERPCLLNGAPFIEGRIAPTAMLELGSVVVCVKFVPRQREEPSQRSASSTPPAVQALGLLGLAVGFYIVLGEPVLESSALERSVVAPPALAFDDQPCPQADVLSARALAAEARFAAEAKRERAPFYPSDGRSAVSLFRRAASCFERAGEQPDAHASRESAEQLRAHLADELHVRHVRLERLLAERKFAEAKRESQLLAELIGDPAHAYGQWLASVVREGDLQAKQGAKP